MLPIEGGKDLLIDPSTVDLTGRTLEFFGNYTHLDQHHPRVKRADSLAVAAAKFRWLLGGAMGRVYLWHMGGCNGIDCGWGFYESFSYSKGSNLVAEYSKSRRWVGRIL